jgi:hypothetical protein
MCGCQSCVGTDAAPTPRRVNKKKREVWEMRVRGFRFGTHRAGLHGGLARGHALDLHVAVPAVRGSGGRRSGAGRGAGTRRWRARIGARAVSDEGSRQRRQFAGRGTHLSTKRAPPTSIDLTSLIARARASGEGSPTPDAVACPDECARARRSGDEELSSEMPNRVKVKESSDGVSAERRTRIEQSRQIET